MKHPPQYLLSEDGTTVDLAGMDMWCGVCGLCWNMILITSNVGPSDCWFCGEPMSWAWRQVISDPPDLGAE